MHFIGAWLVVGLREVIKLDRDAQISQLVAGVIGQVVVEPCLPCVSVSVSVDARNAKQKT